MLCFSMICGSAGSKSNFGKAAGAEVAVERRHEKLQHVRFGPLFEVEMLKNCTPL